jgi:hypothetical protein
LIVGGGGFVWGMVQGEVPWTILLFFTPFVLAGIFTPLLGCWMAWGTTEVHLDNSGVTLARKMFSFQSVCRYPAAEFESFSICQVNTNENGTPVFACRLTAGRRKTDFGNTLSAEDQQWLVTRLSLAATGLGLGVGA